MCHATLIDPFFMASSTQHPFFMYNVRSILSDWRRKPVLSSSGPRGLQTALKSFIKSNGGIICTELFAPNNITEALQLRPIRYDKGPYQKEHARRQQHQMPAQWQFYQGAHALQATNASRSTMSKIGFLPNYAVDPTACRRFLMGCRRAHCHERDDIRETGAKFVHHCLHSW